MRKTTSNEQIKWYESGEGKEMGTIEKGTQVRGGGVQQDAECGAQCKLEW